MARYLTARLAGTGGSIKEEPDDFFVEEIPLYLPCGEGEHLYLTVEKRGLTTLDLVAQLARVFGVGEREIGYAGLKDARATTRQTVSLPGIPPERGRSLDIPGVAVLAASRHRNKLRPGHLAGNRFRIRIRGVDPGALETARDCLHVLQEIGVPNLFGEQRYGSLANSHAIGGAIVRGDFEAAARQIVGDPDRIRDPRWRQGAERYRADDLAGALAVLPGRCREERRLIERLLAGHPPRQAVLGLSRKLLRLYLSAFQSSLFDRLLMMRLDSLEVLWHGDFAYRHDNGACFFVDDPVAEQPRADRLEISPSGPLFGYRTTLARGQAGLLEESLLEHERLSLGDFRLPGGLGMEGERRPLRVPLKEAEIRQEGDDLILAFSLPKGSYATSVLREIIKPSSDHGGG